MIIRRELTWIREDEHTFCFVVPGGRTRRSYTIKIMDQHPVITGGYITDSRAGEPFDFKTQSEAWHSLIYSVHKYFEIKARKENCIHCKETYLKNKKIKSGTK